MLVRAARDLPNAALAEPGERGRDLALDDSTTYAERFVPERSYACADVAGLAPTEQAEGADHGTKGRVFGFVCERDGGRGAGTGGRGAHRAAPVRPARPGAEVASLPLR